MHDKLITVSLSHSLSRRLFLLFLFVSELSVCLVYISQVSVGYMKQRKTLGQNEFQNLFSACCVVCSKEHENDRTRIPDYKRYRSNMREEKERPQKLFLQPKVSSTVSAPRFFRAGPDWHNYPGHHTTSHSGSKYTILTIVDKVQRFKNKKTITQ